MSSEADEAPLEAARASGLVPGGGDLLVLLSGGADSTCLLDVALRLGAQVRALHVNHGLREGADADEAHCRALCEALGLELVVERAPPPAAGNLQAEARRLRYAAAERVADVDYATAHTRSDQAETVLYRLATSPGRRALLGMAPRRGRLVRPLLEVDREETRAYCRGRGLEWREDPSNADPRFARARVREEVLPVLRDLAPAAERTIADTAQQLRDEAEVLEAAIDAVAPRGAGAVSVAALAAQPPALRRLALARLAREAAGVEAASLSPGQAARVLELLERGEGSAAIDVGGGLRAVVEYGTVRFTGEPAAATPDPVELPVPGAARFGEWDVRARAAPEAAGEEAVLDAGAVGGSALVRAWREGDRMRPAGLGGSKSLQDLFVDAKVPRELRAALPVFEIGGQIAWVAGLAVGEGFRARTEEGRPAVALTARRRPGAASARTLGPDA